MTEISKLDIDHLTQNDVLTLIDAEKHPQHILEYQDIVNQIQQSLVLVSNTYRCTVEDKTRHIIYDFNIHSTPISTHFSIGLMFNENKYHLIRLDFGDNLRHTNNVGTSNETVIVGSHAHFNAPSGKYSPKNVIPIGDFNEFKNLKKIKDVLSKFIDYTNITT